MRHRIVVLAVVGLLAVGLAWAAGEKGEAGKMTPAEHAAKLKEKLNLNDAQTDKVRAVFEDIHKRMAELHAKAGEPATASPEAKHEAKKKLKEERDARLKAILTPEQFARYKEMMAEHERKPEKH